MNGQVVIRGSDHFVVYWYVRMLEGNTGKTWKVYKLFSVTK